MNNPPQPGEGRIIAIVGGAGFVGCNLAHYYAREGVRVRVIDNLAREGSEKNLEWLKREHGERIEFRRTDIRDATQLGAALDGVDSIFHMAAQVAVTTSLHDPREDFMVNAAGTLNILEHVRRRAPDTPLVFASTNKVYGCLEHIRVALRDSRYEPLDPFLASNGIGEDHSISLRTPYGCSKGAADQYVADYAKSFGLRAAVIRMSCVYGPRQFGNEDQGWVAHFAIRALQGSPITIYGDGAQVRDVLHVNDAVSAYRLVLDRIDSVKGEAFNLGGGPGNAISLLNLIEELETVTGQSVQMNHAPWRTGDQPWFVADTSKLSARLHWRADVAWRDGLRDLVAWLRASISDEHANSGTRQGGPDRRRSA